MAILMLQRRVRRGMQDSSPDSKTVKPRQTWHQTWMSVAQIMAKRSLCERDQVGAVVVSDTKRGVATGYNGPPRGFNAEPHVNMRQTSCSSWCSRAQQVCVCGHHQSNHTGAHESPTACGSCGCWGYDGLPKSYDNCPSLHAEANAPMVCDYRDRENGTIYVTSR